MLELVIIFLCLSLVLYVLLGGADYGAGIIEMFSPENIKSSEQKTIYSAMGPVWEANHVWLILIVVILFVGFPSVYSILLIHLHIPVSLALIGIILRGTAFTFRHYDAIIDRSQKIYTLIFHISSVWTPLFLGITLGGVLSGKIDAVYTNFYDSFIYPWFNFFSFAMGLFTIMIFSYLASVYLIGETKNNELKTSFIKRSKVTGLLTMLSGAFVFITSEIEGLNYINLFLDSYISIASMILATIAVIVFFYLINQGSIIAIRLLVGLQVLMITIGWFSFQFPVIVNTKFNDITFYNGAAQQIVIDYLGGALIIGLLFIIPALLYLFKIFKTSNSIEHV